MSLIEHKKKINTAIESSPTRMLSVLDFIKVTDYKIDNLTFELLWRDIENDTLIYLNDEILTWIDYKGEFSIKKIACIKTLTSNNIPYIELNYEGMKKSLSMPMGIDKNIILPTGRGSKNTKFYFLTPKNLSNLLMVANTDRSKLARSYFIDMEELFRIYCKYQAEYSNRACNIISAAYLQKDEDIKRLELQKQEEMIKRDEDIKRLEEVKVLEIKKKEEELAKLQEELDKLKEEAKYKKPEQITSKGGFIYCMATEDNHKHHTYKIGRSINTDKRQNQFNTSSSSLIYKYHEIEVFCPAACENILHKALDMTRASVKEYFNVNLEKAIKIMNIIRDGEERLIQDINAEISLSITPALKFEPVEIKNRSRIKKVKIKIDNITEDEAKTLISRLDLVSYDNSNRLSQAGFISLLNKYYTPTINVTIAKDIAAKSGIYSYIRWNK